MTLNTPLLFDFQHKKSDEIRTKHKKAIRQLHYASTIRKILRYFNPERYRFNRTGPAYLLSNAQIDKIILYFTARFVWTMAHIFWTIEWLKVL
ncbi:hypothetical protein BDZ45DRAFT_670093, partial [Acephala macrosclerotiorum]